MGTPPIPPPPPPDSPAMPGPAPYAPRKMPGKVKVAFAIGVVVVLGLVALNSGSLGSSEPKFYSHYIGSDISPGGRWEVAISVKNLGDSTAVPHCKLVAIDGDGMQLASDSIDLDPLDPGQSTQIRALTGLKPGANTVSYWQVICS